MYILHYSSSASKDAQHLGGFSFFLLRWLWPSHTRPDLSKNQSSTVAAFCWGLEKCDLIGTYFLENLMGTIAGLKEGEKHIVVVLIVGM